VYTYTNKSDNWSPSTTGIWSTNGSIITFTNDDESSYSYVYRIYDYGESLDIGDDIYYY